MAGRAEHRLGIWRAKLWIQAHRPAQTAKQRAMCHHQNRPRQRQRAIGRRHASLAQIGERFAILRREVAIHPIREPVSHRLAFLHTERDFAQPFIQAHRQPQGGGDDIGRVMRARQWGGNDADNPASRELARRLLRLRNTARIERNVDIALAEVSDGFGSEPWISRTWCSDISPACSSNITACFS